MDFTNKKVCVLGLGISGLSATKRLLQLGAKVFVSDRNDNALSELQKLDCEFELEGHTDKVIDNEFIVVSPGIRLDIPILKKAREDKVKILSEIELGYLLKPTKTKIIAVTGTNGKSTVVSLIKHILEVGGVKVGLAGNIGFPITSYDLQKEQFDYLVLELSSFQLELLDTFKADIAILLNITPDHLDRYSSFEEYSQIKYNIFNNQNKRDKAIFTSTISKHQIDSSCLVMEDYLHGNEIVVNGFIFRNFNKNLLGNHNLKNITFAVLACYGKVPNNLIQEGINKFLPLEHRLERFCEKDGVVFVNDSKATTVDSTLCALQAFEQKIILILGGSDKGEDFNRLLPVLKEKCRKVYLIGQTGKVMYSNFRNAIECEYVLEFEDCVKEAISSTKSGDVVLLSPACASYDMFKNFEQRGKIFKELVKKLI